MGNNFTWAIICVVLMLWSAVSSVRMAARVIHSRKVLADARANNEAVVRGNSTVYRTGYYVAVTVTEFLAFLFFARNLLRYLRTGGFLPLILAVLCLSTLVMLVIHIIAAFQQKYVYLTQRGLITYVDCHTFEKCRFAWENSDAALSDTLHVYIKKDPHPYTVRFEGDLETAHRITDENAER